MDVEPKLRKMRIISGSPEEIDARLELLLDDYAVYQINYCQGNDRVIVTVTLVNQRDLRMAAMMAGGNQPRV